MSKQEQTEYRYKLTTTGAGSAKYGPCEVCGEHVSEVFSQSEERRYNPPGTLKEHLEDAANYKGSAQGWTHAGCVSYFGHKACLISKRH